MRGRAGFITAALIILAILALYSVNRFTLGHSIPDEKRYIQSTKEMIASGDYITPHYHGKLRFQKPILFYWLIILSYKIFGVCIFGARFPAIIAGVLNAITAFLIAQNLFNRKVGIFAALVLATSEICFIYSRFAVPDMVFALFINTALCSFITAYLGKLKGEFRYMYVYAFMALAVLTKGPLGLIFPLFVIVVFLAIRREWRVLKDMKLALGLLIFLLISAPWFIAMIKLHGNEYISNVWSLEIAKKLNFASSGGANPLIHYFSSVFYYLSMAFLRNLPWSVFLPAAVMAIPYYKDRPRSLDTSTVADSAMNCGFKSTAQYRPRANEMRRGVDFLLAWFFAILAPLTLIWSRESYYILPLSIPLAIFVGLYLAALTEREWLTKKVLFNLPFILITLFSFFALIAWLFFAFYGLGRPVISPSLFMFLPIGFLIYAYVHRDKRMFIPASLVVAAFAFFAYFGAYVISIVDDEPLISFAEDIKVVIKDGDLIGASSSGASYHRLNVYLDEYDVKNINGSSDSLNEFLSTKDARVFCVVSRDDYERFLTEKTKKHTFIMAKAFRWRRFEKEDVSYFLKMLSYIMHNNRELFQHLLKYEIYLVSNMP